MRLIKLLPFAAFAFSGLASATAPARIEGNSPSIVVKYDENTLASVKGAKTLHLRLRAAAETVCSELESRELGLREQYAKCVRDAMARSVADVDNVNLTSYHRNHAFTRVAAN
jgi:UrcA family protein